MGAYIIAEAGVNHNGRLDLARELCLAAKNAGADCVKFQTWQTEKIITRSVAQADYQADNTGRTESQFDMLKRLELSYDDFRAVKAYCDEIGIQFASTADEADSLDFLLTLGIPFIKIGSGEIGNIPYLRYMGSKKKPVLLSTGMSSLADVELSLEALRQGGAEDITLLHCTTSYPCPYDRVNLRAMDTLRAAFGLPVGYSDHTEGSAFPQPPWRWVQRSSKSTSRWTGTWKVRTIWPAQSRRRSARWCPPSGRWRRGLAAAARPHPRRSALFPRSCSSALLRRGHSGGHPPDRRPI